MRENSLLQHLIAEVAISCPWQCKQSHLSLLTGVWSVVFLCASVHTASPRIAVTSPPTVIVNETSSMTLSCTAMGRPPPSVDWYKALAKLSNGGRMTISNIPFITPSPVTGLYKVTSSLTVSPAFGSDSSSYKCVASTAKSVPNKSATATVGAIVQGESGRFSITCDSYLTTFKLAIDYSFFFQQDKTPLRPFFSISHAQSSLWTRFKGTLLLPWTKERYFQCWCAGVVQRGHLKTLFFAGVLSCRTSNQYEKWFF